MASPLGLSDGLTGNAAASSSSMASAEGQPSGGAHERRVSFAITQERLWIRDGCAVLVFFWVALVAVSLTILPYSRPLDRPLNPGEAGAGSERRARRRRSPAATTKEDVVVQRNQGCVARLKEYPGSIPFIIGNEFCERFSYYGMRAILVLYLTNYVMVDEDRAVVIFHMFVFFSYFFPLVGGVLSDQWLGKFKTILLLSLVYCLGNVAMSVTAIPGVTGDPPKLWGTALGLSLIAVGTGGIKPCVSAFGGDQFGKHQQHLVQGFFAMFYFAINSGSTVSMIATPILREDVGCGGRDDCYPLAFGVPAALMIIATVIFVIGRPKYKVVPPEGNVFFHFVGILWEGIKSKWCCCCCWCCCSGRARGGGGEHWLDAANYKYQKREVDDVKAALRVLVLFLPLPLFWALFDQQSSRWTAQATRLYGHGVIKPDQMQAINALFIVAGIPIFQAVVYPAIAWCGINFRPLRRMGMGMLVCALSFVCAALVQIRVEQTCCADLSPTELTEMFDQPAVAFNFTTAGGDDVTCALEQCDSMFLQVPQYIVLTCGEIMFSITGLEFAYSQAPASMKSIMSSAWLLTVAFGSVIVVVVAEASFFESQTLEFFFFAFLIIVALGVFVVMAVKYRYVDPVAVSAEAYISRTANDDIWTSSASSADERVGLRGAIVGGGGGGGARRSSSDSQI